MREIDKIEYSKGCSHIGTCWNRNCWQFPSRIYLTSFHSSTLLLHKCINNFKIFRTGIHEIDKIEYSRGHSHIGTCWIQNYWQFPSRIYLTSFHSSTLLLHKCINNFKIFRTGIHEIDMIEYSRGHSHIGTCWIQNCWQSPSRICLTSFHNSTLLLHKFISSFKIFSTGMHEINKIEWIFKGVFCEFLGIFYINILSCGVFLEWEANGNFLIRVSGSEKYSIFWPVGIYILHLFINNFLYK